MNYSMYSVRDLKTTFGNPFLEKNDAAAIRGFTYAINSGNELMHFRPGDYDLYKIGEFDPETGIIEDGFPKLVVSGSSVVE